MAKKQQEQMWVDPEFKKLLKIKATESDFPSMLDFTRSIKDFEFEPPKKRR